MKLNALHHITIIESGSTKCAWVRIGDCGEYFQQSFAYRKFGGKRNAIREAKRVRDIMGKKVFGDRWPQPNHSHREHFALNTSGTVGVSYRKKDKTWVAYWQSGSKGKRKQCKAYFQVKKFGYQSARRMAIEKRKIEVERNRIF